MAVSSSPTFSSSSTSDRVPQPSRARLRRAGWVGQPPWGRPGPGRRVELRDAGRRRSGRRGAGGSRARTPAHGPASMIDQGMLQRVLGAALRTGGEFAEMYVEDKRSSSAALDDGRVEEVTSGRDRGAGMRVVSGETTGYAHTADLSEDGLRPQPKRPGGGPARWRGRQRRRPHRTLGAAGAHRDLPRDHREGQEGRAAAAGRRGGPRRGLGDRPGVRRVRRQPQAHPRGQLRRAVGRGRSGPHAVPHLGRLPATPGCRRATRGSGARWGGSCSTARRGGDGAPGGPPRPHQARRPAGAGGQPARRHQGGQGWRAVPRGLRPRPGGRSRRQGRLGVPGQGRPAGRRPTSHWSTTAR